MSLGRYVGIVDIRTLASEARLRKLTTAVVDFEKATVRATPQTTLFGKRVYEVVPAAKAAETQVGRFGRITGILSGMIVKASIMSFVLHLMFARVEHTTERVRDMQERYNEVVEKFGPASVQAERALRNLRLAQADLTRATREQYIQFVLFGSQIVLIAKDAIDLIRQLGGVRRALAGLAALRAIPARLGAAAPLLRVAGPLGIAALAAFAFGAIVPPLVFGAFRPRERVRIEPPRVTVETEEGIEVRATKTRRYVARELTGLTQLPRVG